MPKRTKIDAVWLLGTGSELDDWELRHSMRSFKTHFRDLGRLWLIGHIPHWIDQRRVRCIPFPDPYQRCKDANLLHKLLRLAFEPDLSETFILVSDDQFLLKSAGLEDFEPYYVEDLSLARPGRKTTWTRRLFHTAETLRRMGRPSLNFDGHVPMPVQKAEIPRVLEYAFAAGPGLTIMTLFFNASDREGVPITIDRIRASLCGDDLKPAAIDRKLAVNLFASIDAASARNPYLRSKLETLYPTPSPAEASPPRTLRAPSAEPPRP